MEKPEKIMERLADGKAGHTPNCRCHTCMDGQLIWLSEADIKSIQRDAICGGYDLAHGLESCYEFREKVLEILSKMDKGEPYVF